MASDPESLTTASVAVDSSAVLAVLLEERGHAPILQRLLDAELVICGGPTLVETGMVLGTRKGGDFQAETKEFIRRFRVEVVPFREEHYHVALTAFEKYGKGRHPAALNFGDCLSYAAAKVAGLPLLYVGDDFSRTDIGSAL